MSRLFNGTSNFMTFTPTDWAFGTLLVVARIMTTNDVAWQSFIEGEAPGGLRYAFGRSNSGNLYLANGITTASAVAAQDADGWAIYAVTKATGTVAPTMHRIPIGGTRTSTAPGTTLTNSTTIAGGSTKVGGDDDFANIRLAAVAIFNGTVLTTTQLDGINTAKTTQSIADLSPTALYDDSDAFATDLIGSADRTAISGTTDDADDPSGWVYGLGGGGTTFDKTGLGVVGP